MQTASVSATTDANGFVDYTFANPINGCVGSAAGPQSGDGSGIVSMTVRQTGSNKVTCRFWKTLSSPDSGSVLAAGNEAVTFNLIAF